MKPLFILLVLTTMARADHPSVCEVSTPKGYGTGTLIAKDEGSALILTSNHVLRGRKKVRVFFPETGQGYTGTTYRTDERNDLALVEITSPEGIEPVEVSRLPMRFGLKLTAIGYGEEEYRETACKVEESIRRSTGESLIKLSYESRDGDSGGPVLVSGRLFAVHKAIRYGRALAVHPSRVRAFLHNGN